MVKAYAAGLGYRPSTKKKHKRIVDGAGGNGGGGGSGDGTDDGDTASVETVATSLSAGSSLSSGEHPATDWWTDGGVSNRWAMGPAVRKALFLSLQAGAVAHLPLKQRRAAELPWVEVRFPHKQWVGNGDGLTSINDVYGVYRRAPANRIDCLLGE